MLQLKLVKISASLANFNPRTEKHGQEEVPAADLKITVVTGCEILAQFGEGLKSSMFDEAGPRDLADGLPLREQHLVYPLATDHEMTGAVCSIEFGVGKPMEFSDAKCKGFKLTPYAGGSVEVEFTVQCKPDEKQAGKLFLLQKRAITLSLEPAALPEMKEQAA